MGIPLPWLGIGFYLTLLLLSLCAYGAVSRQSRARLLGAVLWLSVMGVSFSAVLMFIQFRVLHAFCPLCTASAVVVASLVYAVSRAERIAADADFSGRGNAALALGVFAMIPGALQTISATSTRTDVLASVDGHTFTRAQMEEEMGVSLFPLQRSIYSIEYEWVKKKVDATLLAGESKRTGADAEALLAARVNVVKPAADAEIDARLAAKGLTRNAETVKQVADEILAENREQARVEYLGELAKGHRVEVFLKPPSVTALRIDLASAKVIGTRDAKVQLVVFSDFQCHFCAELASVLKRARNEFPNDVLIAYRYFPIEEHERAVPAAVAAECAAEQGAFWEYHDQLYADGDLSDAALASIAGALGLDQGRFAECRTSGRARAAVEASRADAVANGLEGTPALFLNGRMIGGMIDYAKLTARIKEELRASSGK